MDLYVNLEVPEDVAKEERHFLVKQGQSDLDVLWPMEEGFEDLGFGLSFILGMKISHISEFCTALHTFGVWWNFSMMF